MGQVATATRAAPRRAHPTRVVLSRLVRLDDAEEKEEIVERRSLDAASEVIRRWAGDGRTLRRRVRWWIRFSNRHEFEGDYGLGLGSAQHADLGGWLRWRAECGCGRRLPRGMSPEEWAILAAQEERRRPGTIAAYQRFLERYAI